MTDKEKTIKELKEALDGLDITNKYRLNIIRAIEYLQEEPVSEEWIKELRTKLDSMSKEDFKRGVGEDCRRNNRANRSQCIWH